MNKQEKTEQVALIIDLLKNSSAVFLTDYQGINVADISTIRNEFRKEGVKYKVVKNTLFKRAIQEIGGYENLEPHLVGMTGFAFASENPVAPAKIIKKFNDASSKLNLKACYIDTQYYDGSQLNALATLPTKPEVVAGILASLNSPAQGIVGAINAVMRDLASVVDEIAKKKAA